MASDLKLAGQIYLLSFKKDLDELHLKQLLVIINDKTSTKQQIKDNIQTFFEEIGGEIFVKFNKIQTKLLFKQGIYASKIHSCKNDLSEEAKAILEKASKIKNDFSLTPEQEKRKLSELFGSVSDSVKSEFEILAKVFGKEKWI
uniref:Uncharacterized protein n=1 Tax=Panagrolaimus davidi TaxID=227884 RepID=A0A914QCS9_9BILA